jgi:hypothetical protein
MVLNIDVPSLTAGKKADQKLCPMCMWHDAAKARPRLPRPPHRMAGRLIVRTTQLRVRNARNMKKAGESMDQTPMVSALMKNRARTPIFDVARVQRVHMACVGCLNSSVCPFRCTNDTRGGNPKYPKNRSITLKSTPSLTPLCHTSAGTRIVPSALKPHEKSKEGKQGLGLGFLRETTSSSQV